MPTFLSRPTSFRWRSPLLQYVARSIERTSIGIDWRRSSIAPDVSRESGPLNKAAQSALSLCRARPNAALTLEKTLLLSRLPQRTISVEVRRHPFSQPLGVQHGTVTRVVVAHPGQCFGEPLRYRRIEVGPGCEHAVIVGRRCPNFAQ